MKKETVQNILYSPLYLVLWLHAILSMRILYILSDILFFPLFYLVRYRRALVQKNLRNSFPEKSDRELRTIERNFYRHFCDYIVETIKLLHISDKEMKRRMAFENAGLVDSLIAEGKSVMLLLGHFGNWEWIPSMRMWLTDDAQFYGQIYRPLKNEWFDRLMLRMRGRFGTQCIPKKETVRRIIGFKKNNERFIIGFMSDQTPSHNNIHHWTTFLNQDTAVLTGYETLAIKNRFAVVYVDVECIRRGYYKATYRELSRDAGEFADFELADRYMAEMEKTIRRKPEGWLWTHKRWKHKRVLPETAAV